MANETSNPHIHPVMGETDLLLAAQWAGADAAKKKKKKKVLDPDEFGDLPTRIRNTLRMEGWRNKEQVTLAFMVGNPLLRVPNIGQQSVTTIAAWLGYPREEFGKKHYSEFTMLMEARTALRAILNRYIDLANSGDCGHWNPEEEKVVIEARKALALLDVDHHQPQSVSGP